MVGKATINQITINQQRKRRPKMRKGIKLGTVALLLAAVLILPTLGQAYVG